MTFPVDDPVHRVDAQGMETSAAPKIKTVRLVPNEGTAQAVDQITIRDASYTLKGLYASETVTRFEVTMGHGSCTPALETEWRTGSNAFPTYGEAAAYANGWIKRNGRHAAK